MSLIDFIILFLLSFTTAIGFFFGLITVIGAILTIIISIITASLFFNQLAPSLLPYAFENANLARVAAFLIIYWVCSLVLSIAVKIANKLFNLPLLKTMNRIGGALISLIGTIIIISVFLHLIATYAWTQPIHELINVSMLARYLLMLGKLVILLIPGI